MCNYPSTTHIQFLIFTNRWCRNCTHHLDTNCHHLLLNTKMREENFFFKILSFGNFKKFTKIHKVQKIFHQLKIFVPIANQTLSKVQQDEGGKIFFKFWLLGISRISQKFTKSKKISPSWNFRPNSKSTTQQHEGEKLFEIH